jgi:hypothetical protein
MARFPAPQKTLQQLTNSQQRRGMADNIQSVASARNRQEEGAPMADKSNDPAVIWQTTIGEWGVHLLRQSGHGLAEIPQGDEPGRRRNGGRA